MPSMTIVLKIPLNVTISKTPKVQLTTLLFASVSFLSVPLLNSGATPSNLQSFLNSGSSLPTELFFQSFRLAWYILSCFTEVWLKQFGAGSNAGWVVPVMTFLIHQGVRKSQSRWISTPKKTAFPMTFADSLFAGTTFARNHKSRNNYFLPINGQNRQT